MGMWTMYNDVREVISQGLPLALRGKTFAVWVGFTCRARKRATPRCPKSAKEPIQNA